MKIILITSQKGGSGKTTTAVNMASIYQQRTLTTLIDTDPQGTSLMWGKIRENNVKSDLFVTYAEFNKIKNILKVLEKEGVENVIIDTAPILAKHLDDLIQLADYVVVPIMTGAGNLATVKPTINIINRYQKPFGFVISQAETNTNIFRETKELLEQHGDVVGVIKKTILIKNAELDGKGVAELRPSHVVSRAFETLTKQVDNIVK